MDTDILISFTPTCRYCLSTDNVEGMISPCRCSGTSQYVHKQCLIEWLNSKGNRLVYPFVLNKFGLKCEICLTSYQLKTEKVFLTHSLNSDIAIYIFITTLILFTLYLSSGAFLYAVDKTGPFIDRGNAFENVLANGFVLTHILIGIFYIIKALILGLPNSVCGCDCENIGSNDIGCVIILVLIILAGILGGFIAIYIDVINKVMDRHENGDNKVIDVYTLVPEQVN